MQRTRNIRKKKKASVFHDPLVDLLVRKYRPDKIILFGSRARGTAHLGSDLDLVVIKKTEAPMLKRMREVAILRSKANLTQPADILVYTPEEFTALSRRWNPFFHRILTEGKVVYGG